jgi:ammonia channel protein AmtB
MTWIVLALAVVVMLMVMAVLAVWAFWVSCWSCQTDLISRVTEDSRVTEIIRVKCKCVKTSHTEVPHIIELVFAQGAFTSFTWHLVCVVVGERGKRQERP